MTQEAKRALRIIEEKLNNLTLLRLDYTKPFSLILLNTEYTPTGCLWQEGPLEWLHLPVAQKRVLVSYPDLVALLLYKGRQRAKELFGKEPNSIIVPYTAQQLDMLLINNDQWQICYSNYKGQTLYHLPNHPLLQFIKTHPVIFHRKFSITPLPPPASLVFTDGSSNGTAAYIIDGKQFSTQYPKQSAQKVELLAVIEVFSKLTEKEFNLYTDSMYIVNLFPHIESAPLSPVKSTIHNMLAQLQTAITQRVKRFFVGHIRAHKQLPGSLQEGNTMADKLTQQIFSLWEEAKQSHAIHHQNSRALALQFKLTREQARQIVKQCHICPQYHPSLPMGVNPRGLRANSIWQMDVTHITSFGKLSYVHVVIDTFSHALWATARTGEAVKDVIHHLFASFAVLGKPQTLKTDNAPAYTAKSFKNFCIQMSISHVTGVPYNPQGQGIVERAHQNLKNQIHKLQQGEYKYSSPHHVLSHALFVLNHLNVNNEGTTALERHYSKESKPVTLVKWRDLLTGQWKGPDVLLTSGRGYACVFPQDSATPIWIPDRLIRHHESPVANKTHHTQKTVSTTENPAATTPDESSDI